MAEFGGPYFIVRPAKRLNVVLLPKTSFQDGLTHIYNVCTQTKKSIEN